MCSLDMFPEPELSGHRSLRELNERLDEGMSDCLIIDEGKIYPTIEVKNENIIKPSIINESVENIFIEKDIKLWKRALHYYQHKSFISALQLICDYNNIEEINSNLWLKISQKLASSLLYLWNLLLTIYVYLYPYALKSNDELCNEFNKSLDWKNGVIRAFEWHPSCHRCAICLVNDCVYIHNSNNSFVPLLKHSLQTKVTGLSWRPNRDDILGVSCESAILIWTIDPNSKLYRPPNDCVRIIQTSITSPLTSLSFDINGEYLVTCSPQSSKLTLIKMDTNPEEIKTIRQFGTCFTKLFWSPDKTRLLSTTTSKYIRVFENKCWSSNKWGQEFTGICQTACWSRPNGRILLVAPRNCMTVFAIPFYDTSEPNDVGGTHNCFELLDVSPHEFPNGIKVGGSIHDMIWDKNSERLAISFKDNSQYIALYKTVIRPNLEISPIGFVHGLSLEIPLIISFHDCFKTGSLLTVCWNSGVVSYIPLQFDSKSTKSSHTTNGTPRSLTSFCVSSPHLNISHNSTPVKGSPYRRSTINSSLLQFTPNDSVLSPKRPLLFTTLAKHDLSGNILVE